MVALYTRCDAFLCVQLSVYNMSFHFTDRGNTVVSSVSNLCDIFRGAEDHSLFACQYHVLE